METAEGRPPLIGVPRFLTATLLLSGALAAADDQRNEGSALPRDSSATTDPTVYRWMFGDGSDAVAVRRQLDMLLRERIAIVDRFCQLTDIQQEKLQLAGAGDNARLVDRVEEIGGRYRVVKDNPAKVLELRKEAELLKTGLIRPGLSPDGALFLKLLEKLLTAEQRRYR